MLMNVLGQPFHLVTLQRTVPTQKDLIPVPVKLDTQAKVFPYAMVSHIILCLVISAQEDLLRENIVCLWLLVATLI